MEISAESLTAAILLESFISRELNRETVSSIASILGFANSFATFAVLQVLSRKTFIRWRTLSWTSLTVLWVGILLVLLEILSPVSIGEIRSASVKVGVIAWSAGLMLLLYLIRKILVVDLIGFSTHVSRGGQPLPALFKPALTFGIPAMDTLIEQAKPQKLYYPLLLIGDRTSAPHHFAQRFMMAGITEGGTGIYFTFTRPPSIILSQLSRRGLEPVRQGSQIFIVDCYSPLARRRSLLLAQGFPRRQEEPVIPRDHILPADPRDPHAVNKAYERAISKVSNHSSLRVVYDSLSDFLLFADTQIIITYLRHNVVWEEQNNIESIYILWPEALQGTLSDSYLTWYSNTPVWMKEKSGKIELSVQSLFNQTLTRMVDYDYKIVENPDKGYY